MLYTRHVRCGVGAEADDDDTALKEWMRLVAAVVFARTACSEDGGREENLAKGAGLWFQKVLAIFCRMDA